MSDHNTNLVPLTPSSPMWTDIHGNPSTMSGSLPATNNIVYVAPVGGNDTTGDGSYAKPYASLNKAYSVITTATITNPFTIQIINGGQYYEPSGTTHMKSNVALIGPNSTFFVIQTPCVVDVVASESGFVEVRNVTFFNSLTYDGSTATVAGMYIYTAYVSTLTYRADPSNNGFLSVYDATLYNPTSKGYVSSFSVTLYGTWTVESNSPEVEITGSEFDLSTSLSVAGTSGVVLAGNSKLPSFVVASGSVSLTSDSSSYPTSITGSPTIVLYDNAPSVGYSPSVPGNWSPVPSVVAPALDQLAADIAGLGSLYANVNLSNLASPTAINQSLLFNPSLNIGDVSTNKPLNIYAVNSMVVAPGDFSGTNGGIEIIQGTSVGLTNGGVVYAGTAATISAFFGAGNASGYQTFQMGFFDATGVKTPEIYLGSSEGASTLGLYYADNADGFTEHQMMYWDLNSAPSSVAMLPASDLLMSIGSLSQRISTLFAQTIRGDLFEGAQIATPSNPAAGYDKLYFKSDDKLYGLNSSGVEVLIGPSTGGSQNLSSVLVTGNDAGTHNIVNATAIVAGSATPVSPFGDPEGLQSIGDGVDRPIYTMTFANNGHGAQMAWLKARGSQASPSAVNSGDDLGFLAFGGYGSSAFNEIFGVIARATENFSNTANGSKLLFQSIPNGTAGRVNRWELSQDGNWIGLTAGAGFKIAEGSDARMGKSTLVGGTVTVSNATITNNTRIFLTNQNGAGTPGFLYVSARSAGTSFTITSSSGTDTSDVAWLLVEPS